MSDIIAGLGQGSNYFAAPKVNSSKNPIEESQKASGTTSTEKKSHRDEVNEVGFRQYVKNIEKEKLEELRAQILQSMGLSEEDLSKMSGEQRSNIESLIAREIQERMLASKALSNDKEENSQRPVARNAETYQPPTASGNSDGSREREKNAEPVLFSFLA